MVSPSPPQGSLVVRIEIPSIFQTGSIIPRTTYITDGVPFEVVTAEDHIPVTHNPGPDPAISSVQRLEKRKYHKNANKLSKKQYLGSDTVPSHSHQPQPETSGTSGPSEPQLNSSERVHATIEPAVQPLDHADPWSSPAGPESTPGPSTSLAPNGSSSSPDGHSPAGSEASAVQNERPVTPKAHINKTSKGPRQDGNAKDAARYDFVDTIGLQAVAPTLAKSIAKAPEKKYDPPSFSMRAKAALGLGGLVKSTAKEVENNTTNAQIEDTNASETVIVASREKIAEAMVQSMKDADAFTLVEERMLRHYIVQGLPLGIIVEKFKLVRTPEAIKKRHQTLCHLLAPKLKVSEYGRYDDSLETFCSIGPIPSMHLADFKRLVDSGFSALT